MLWGAIGSVRRFRSVYETYLLALEGAIERGVDGLRQRDPRMALNRGLAAVGAAARASSYQPVYIAQSAIAEAVSRGAADAGGTASVDVQQTRSEQLEMVVLNLMSIDAGRARMVIRNQALAYEVAYRSMSHQGALAKATGQLGNDAFTQLDRANRRFQSADMVEGCVRLGVAQAYLDSFVTVASDRGQVTAVLKHPERADELVELADINGLREAFHPNTRYWLELAS